MIDYDFENSAEEYLSDNEVKFCSDNERLVALMFLESGLESNGEYAMERAHAAMVAIGDIDE